MNTRPNILYVDDEQDNLLAFKAVFRRQFQIYTAISGFEAIQLLKDQPIDLIISDQRMPKMTGLEFFEHIIPNHPNVVRMVITGYSEMGPILEAVKQGLISHYLTKPWNVEELRKIIEGALETA
ncbi:MAG: response regulator [Bacteroidota bacterium]